MAFAEPTEQIVEEGDNLRSFRANQAVTRGQVVKLAGEDLGVQPSNTDGEQVIGVATQTVAAGDMVTVAMEGAEVLVTAGTGTIARGDDLASYGATGNEGEVDTATDGTIDFTNSTASKGDYVFAVAYEGSSAAGDLVHAVIDLVGYRPGT